jgi:hypothetical protein
VIAAAVLLAVITIFKEAAAFTGTWNLSGIGICNGSNAFNMKG